MKLLENFIRNSKSGDTQKISIASDVSEGTGGTITSNNGSVRVDEETAMKISAIYQGLNIICDTIGSMPFYLYQEVDGYQQIVEGDKRNNLLSGMANPILSSLDLKRSLLKDLVLKGNGYAEIVREGDNIALEYIPHQYVNPKFDNTGYYFEVQAYTTDVTGERKQRKIIDISDMFIIMRNNAYNSIVGKGLLDYANVTLDTAIEENTYMSNLFKNGLSAKAILNAKNGLKPGIKEKLKMDLLNFYSGSKNAGKMLVLEGDFQLLPLTLSPTDIKLIENKNFTITDIARYLNIPKHLLNIDRQQGTYSNITQERLQLLQNTLLPYVTALEIACNQKLLTEEEQEQGYYFKCNTAEMLKLTPEDQAKYMLDLYKEGIVVVDEVRAALNLSGDADTIAELKNIQLLKHKVKMNEIKVDSDQNIIEEDSKKDNSTDTSKEDVTVEDKKY